MEIKAAILTVSDRSSRGERQDKSGPVIEEILKSIGAEIVEYKIVPDEKDEIARNLKEFAHVMNLDLVVTTGGTGLSSRDVTPEATLSVIDKRIPGFEEAMRAESIKKTPHGMLSRAVSGLCNETIIVNLPGSPKAVKETLPVILPALPHAVEIARG
ncbi:molybdenum cofactor biosynthesis protein [Candidatus Poribacteria bacterium]|nr:molybdenum cofactor biosynthesis protein [Candidatus Poribacteria bacterium]